MAKKKEITPGENLAKQIIEQYKPKKCSRYAGCIKGYFRTDV